MKYYSILLLIAFLCTYSYANWEVGLDNHTQNDTEIATVIAPTRETSSFQLYTIEVKVVWERSTKNGSWIALNWYEEWDIPHTNDRIWVEAKAPKNAYVLFLSCSDMNSFQIHLISSPDDSRVINKEKNTILLPFYEAFHFEENPLKTTHFYVVATEKIPKDLELNKTYRCESISKQKSLDEICSFFETVRSNGPPQIKTIRQSIPPYPMSPRKINFNDQENVPGLYLKNSQRDYIYKRIKENIVSVYFYFPTKKPKRSTSPLE